VSACDSLAQQALQPVQPLYGLPMALMWPPPPPQPQPLPLPLPQATAAVPILPARFSRCEGFRRLL